MDDSRIWYLEELVAGVASTMSTNIRLILLGYMWTDIHVERILNINGNSKNLDGVGMDEKNLLLRTISGYFHDSPRQDNFYCYQKQHWTVLHTGSIIIRVNYKNYNNVPAKYFINESYFLYHKSNLIKETYITALNKRVSIYGSISYFNKKTENEIFKITSPENLPKFFVKKNRNKDSLSIQLTSVGGNLPILKKKKFIIFP